PFLNPNALAELTNLGTVEHEDKTSYTAMELLEFGDHELPMLVEGLIPKTGLFALVGTSDVGKSLLMRQLAVSVARDEVFLGFILNATHNRVIIVNTEDDPKAITSLLSKQ